MNQHTVIRLPVGGSQSVRCLLFAVWCERGDSNPHTFRYQILSLARLPIPPLSRSRFDYHPSSAKKNITRECVIHRGPIANESRARASSPSQPGADPTCLSLI